MSLRHEIRPRHLKPAAELAQRVLLPGDPHRALAVAQHLLDKPRMFNHHRGLWGYSGTAPDGAPLTVQSTGMGGPSTAVVVEELIALGACRLVRIGTCGALDSSLELGTLLAAAQVLPADGASAALGAEGLLSSDPVLLRRLTDAGARSAMVASTDLFYDPREDRCADWARRGVVAVEMESATLFQVALTRGVRAGSVLGVTDVPASNGARRATAEQVEEIGVRLGEAGYAALRAP